MRLIWLQTSSTGQTVASGIKTLARQGQPALAILTLFAQAAAPYAQRASPQTTAVKIVAFLAAAPNHLTGLSASPLSVQTQPPLLALFIAGLPYH